MIRTIAHFSDIHIRKDISRHKEYREIFEKVYDKLRQQKPDRIVIVGDLYHDYIDLEGEAEVLMGEFLNKLSQLTDKVIITRGNHDMRKKQKTRKDVIETITTLINNPKVLYLNKSDFYVDDNIVWVVHHHLEGVNPWYDISHIKDETKTYIDLYHNPIQGCKGHNGYLLKNKKYKLDDLQGDLSMIGDIHLHQIFKDGKVVYPGSLIGQDFGEPIEPHGYLLWNLTKNDFNYIEISNEHNFINFTLKTDTDYDNLNLNHKLLNSLSEIKVKWEDISAKVNFENEIKIRQYFKNTHNISKVKIIKKSIYTDVSKVQMVNESIDVLNLDNQRKIFTEYLELNGYEKEFINKILKIDDIINDRLKLNENNLGLYWTIDKFWFNNFKSYGDNTIVDWKDNDGIYQISGINKQGKTTILDAICYILYGKTTTTLKREKNGDNRYINNKRDLNYCSGGAVITINGQTFTIIRETERKLNKGKTGISSCSTNVDYYIGTDLSEENKLTGERKSNTQETIDNAIGDFSDFIRLVLVNADNLNDSLSTDRSVFIDELIKDCGLSIFDDKLTEFKEYRKELVKNRITIDTEEHRLKVIELSENNDFQKNKLEEVLTSVENLEDSKPNLINEKDETLQKLEKIDESLYDFQLETITESINEEQDKIDKRNIQLKKIEELKVDVKLYSPDELNKKKTEHSDLKDLITLKVSELKDNDIKIFKLNSNINTINSDIKNEINSYTTDLKIIINNNETKITKYKEDFNNKIIHLKSTFKDDLNSLTIDKNNFKNEIELLMEQGKNLKNDTDELEDSLDKECITCHRPMDESSVEVVNKKITENTKAMVDIMTKVKSIKPKIVDIDTKIGELTSKINFITIKDYEFDLELKNSYGKTLSDINNLKTTNSEIEKSIELIKNESLPNDLKIKLETYHDKKEKIVNEISEIDVLKVKLSKVIATKSEELETLSYKIKELTEQDNVYKKNMEVIGVEDKVKLDIEKSNNIIEKYNNQIDTYNKQLDKIQNNIQVKLDIDTITKRINKLEESIKDKYKQKSEYESKIFINNHEMNRLSDEIIKFEEQKKQDEIFDSYQKCVHRDGIPTHLLKMSIHIINERLNNILTDVDFTIFFDEELNFKLSNNNRLDISQNIIESSGMERTFSAVALKMALRAINNHSRPNILLFDEIMTKLVDQSINEFVKLLDVMKNEIDKIIIIEHIHPINYDYLINVTKDEDGVSTLEIE